MKLTHLFNNTCTQTDTSSHLLSCSQHPKTLSFRSIHRDEAFKAAYNISSCNGSKYPPKCSTSFFIDNLLEDEEETVERVIRGLKSDRLFFEPGETNSILGEAKTKASSSSNGCCSNVEKTVTLLSMESSNPYLDFKKSMEEMVEAHGVRGWDWLQELLGCYLKVNRKSNHGFIIGAFVELLVSLYLEGRLGLSCSSFVASSSSPVTFSTSHISTSCSSSSNLPTDEVAALDERLVDKMMMLVDI
uniref:Transcription repressor n=1 Tax=Kalanchoe fedtschenkoi TaxID=63787 RepID=A0A7N0V3K1_KALFE